MSDTPSPRGHDISQVWVDEMARQNVGDDPTFDPSIFITTEGITKADLRDALKEYRDMDTAYPSSPWESLNTLSEDFVNWYRWERL